MRLRYSLQMTISTLFISVIVILGITLTELGFHQTNNVMRKSATELYKHVSTELSTDIKQTYGPMSETLQYLQLSSLIDAENFEQRVKALPMLKAILVTSASASSVGIAYADGDYFSVMKVDSEKMRKKYQVPAGAFLMLRYLNRPEKENEKAEDAFKNNYIYSVFYDESLNEVSRNNGELSNFDPRSRPWYHALNNKPVGEVVRTSPYVFYDSRVVGLSLSVKADKEVVLAFDVTLNNISRTIGKYSKTENSEIVLINAANETIAYGKSEQQNFNQQIELNNEKLKLKPFTQLGSGVLTYVGKKIQFKQQDLEFEYAGENWIGSFLSIGEKNDLFVLMLTPVGELLKNAQAIRDKQYFVTLLMVLLFVPVVWFIARQIAKPLNQLSKEAALVSGFDFRVTNKRKSFIKEVNELDSAMVLMKSTINKFITLINSLAGEKNLDQLVEKITKETLSISHSDGALIYLMNEQDGLLKAHFLCAKDKKMSLETLESLSLSEAKILLEESKSSKKNVVKLNASSQNKLKPLLKILNKKTLSCVTLPLTNRNNEVVGMLCLVYCQHDDASQTNNIKFIEALSGFSAVTLESRQSLNALKELLDAFVGSISDAIDTKSFYTGGHCKRVPELTMMLAKAAERCTEGEYKNFTLSNNQEEELALAGNLHDCGKITTPVYVVDKATKLETIYDRIHEVRMRFEVLKRDAEIECWQKISKGENKQKLLDDLTEHNKNLDKDFAFIAECNVGGEFMADEKIERLQVLAKKKWNRTLDDDLGLSWEELNRKDKNKKTLPVEEKLLADKVEHLIARNPLDKNPGEYQLGFNVDTPKYKYNRGELYNLSVKKGTLSEEERYMINDHMIQTIAMLNKLSFPKHLSEVPLLAGSHHETMDGKGYPKKLIMSEQPRRARMMVIADIFEALTASDRPYKKAKTLNEAVRILSFMRNDKHIDADLFDLFLSSGVYLEYANKFLPSSQIDEVNINDYLS